MLPLFIRGVLCNSMVSSVNIAPLPPGLKLGGEFTLVDYVTSNEIPTVLGNLVGGLTFVGLTLYAPHARTGPRPTPPRIEPAAPLHEEVRVPVA